MHKIWINNKFYSSDKAKISVFDRGFMYGDGAFETMRSYAGAVFKIDDHLRRLFSSLNGLKIRSPYSKRHLRKSIYECLKINNLQSAYIKIAITRGEGRFGLGHRDIFIPNVVIVAKGFEGYPDRMFAKGISAKITGLHNERSILSGIKSLNYLAFIMARLNAKQDGFDDAILMNTRGNITEGATSNIFLITGKTLITPSLDSGALPGITRNVIIDIAKRLNIPVKEKAVSRNELLRADEVFFTSSLAEVMPVTRIDSKCVGSGRPGEYTKLFAISYQKQVIRAII